MAKVEVAQMLQIISSGFLFPSNQPEKNPSVLPWWREHVCVATRQQQVIRWVRPKYEVFAHRDENDTDKTDEII